MNSDFILSTLAFFQSVIRSGESWTPTCAERYEKAKTALEALQKRCEAARALIELVEGVGCKRWQDETGTRLKDTTVWAQFYVAVRSAQRSNREGE